MGSESPSVQGAYDSHGTIRQVLAERSPCKVLDAAAGSGPLSQFLAESGWDVWAADINREAFEVEDVPFVEADLNQELPLEDESFDAVVFANAVHRLYNPAGAIREFYRILRPGGRLYMNANNFAGIETRLRFLLYGAIEYRPPEQWSDPSQPPEATVRIHIDYAQMASHLKTAGFEILRLYPAAVRPRHRLLAPVSWAVRTATLMIPKAKRERAHVSSTSSNAILGGGYYFLIEAMKP